MQELIAYNQWLIKNHDRFFKEYLDTLPKNDKIFKEKLELNVQDIINYAYDLYNIPLHLRKLILENAKRGNNDIANAKGMVVNYILNNKIKVYDYRDIYVKLFSYNVNRVTSVRFRNKDFAKEEPLKWKQFVEYIESNVVDWNPIITFNKLIELLLKNYKVNKNILKKNGGNSNQYYTDLSITVKGIVIKYLSTYRIISYKEINTLFDNCYKDFSSIRYWKKKKLNNLETEIYKNLLNITDNYTIIWT